MNKNEQKPKIEVLESSKHETQNKDENSTEEKHEAKQQTKKGKHKNRKKKQKKEADESKADTTKSEQKSVKHGNAEAGLNNDNAETITAKCEETSKEAVCEKPVSKPEQRPVS